MVGGGAGQVTVPVPGLGSALHSRVPAGTTAAMARRRAKKKYERQPYYSEFRL